MDLLIPEIMLLITAIIMLAFVFEIIFRIAGIFSKDAIQGFGHLYSGASILIVFLFIVYCWPFIPEMIRSISGQTETLIWFFMMMIVASAITIFITKQKK